MSKKLYCLSVFCFGLFLLNNLNAQADTTKEPTAPQTKQEQADTPNRSSADSLDLQTATDQQQTEEEDSVFEEEYAPFSEEPRTVRPFTRIHVTGNYRVHIKQGDKHTVAIEHGTLRNPIYHAAGKTLRIGMSTPFDHFSRGTVYVTMPNLESLKVSGSNYVQSDGTIKVECLEIKGTGASKINLELDADCIELNHSGAVTTILSGNTKVLECRQTGASKLRAADLEAERVEIQITGAGSAHVQVNNVLEVVGSGVCKVRYKGAPEMISKRLAGPCRVIKM